MMSEYPKKTKITGFKDLLSAEHRCNDRKHKFDGASLDTLFLWSL